MSPASPAPAAAVFSALGDETRLALVTRLAAGGPLSISGLTSGSAVTRQAVTRHLEVLSGAGLVHGSRRGRERIWTLDAAQLSEAQRFLELVARGWDDALDRLRTFAEE